MFAGLRSNLRGDLYGPRRLPEVSIDTYAAIRFGTAQISSLSWGKAGGIIPGCTRAQ